MLTRNFGPALVVFTILMASCSPEEIIKDKVPKEIQDVLTFESTRQEREKLPDASSLTIVSPSAGETITAGKEIVFKMTFESSRDRGSKPPEFTWTLFKGKTKVGDIGKGMSAKKKLEPGDYTIDLVMARNEHKVVKKINFKVALTMAGKVTLANGPLSDVAIELMDSSGAEILSQTKSGRDGSFTLEFPGDAEYRVRAVKPGFSFTPLVKKVHYSNDAPSLDFSATKGEISNIVMVGAEGSDEQVSTICPTDEVFLKFTANTDENIKKVNVYLSHTSKGVEKTVSFESTSEEDPVVKQKEPTVVKLKVPDGSSLGTPAPSYTIRLKLTGDMGSAYFGEGSATVKADPAFCFHEQLKEGAALQSKGRNEEAVKAYSAADDFFKVVDDAAPLSPIMENIWFNRAIAYLSLALTTKPGEGPRFNNLSKAMLDLNKVLKANPKDAQAVLLKGMISSTQEDYNAAVKAYSSVLQLEPKLTAARELRAQAHLKTELTRNLLPAVDDLTAALSADPKAEKLRQMRREALKLAAKHYNDKDDSKADVSNLPFQPLEEYFDPVKYLRK